MVLQTMEVNVPRILITEPIAQEGIDLLRYELPEAQIDVRLDLSPERLLALIGNLTGPHYTQPDACHRRSAGESYPFTDYWSRRVRSGQH